MKDESINWVEIRERLASERGATYWRSLEELAQNDAFQEFLAREFPQGASEWVDPVSRRKFLSLAAASLALAGLSACTRQPVEKIIPYVEPPEEIVPGEPLTFATSLNLRGLATGVLVESHSGRPTRIDGNKVHPASLGASDVKTQASILDLYDPDRSQVVRNAGLISTWDAFLTALTVELESQEVKGGAGIRVLTPAVTSPSLAAQIEAFLAKFPQAKWHQHEAVSRESVRAGARAAFGREVEPQYRLDRADVIVSLDADFLYHEPGHLRYAREFSSRRRVSEDSTSMNRLYVIEPTPTTTGAMADHRLSIAAGDMESLARSLASEIGLSVSATNDAVAPTGWVDAVARDLLAHQGRSLVMAGEHQPPAVHALAHAMNDALGNVGSTVVYIDPIEEGPADSMTDLVEDMKAGRVEVLFILEGNPVYEAPADLEFSDALSNVILRVHLGLYDDETAELCHWHIPQAHSLESWGDSHSVDGTVSFTQPLIEPLYGGKTSSEILSAILGQPNRSSYDILRDYWGQNSSAEDFEALWEKALHDGVVDGSAREPLAVSLQDDFLSTPSSASEGDEGLEILFRPDPNIFDGRFANNGWLQELPKPLTRLAWDNAALLSPVAAERRGLQNEDLVELHYQGRSVRAPVWILPGQAENTVTVHLGYGRRRVGKVGGGVGFDAYALRTSSAPWNDSGLEIRKTGERYPLACTQNHQSMEGRHLVREATLDEYRRHPDFAHEMSHEPEEGMTLYPKQENDGYAWGMSIDLNACIGCNACVVGCQSENNIPVVGKTEVLRGREMHWIRVDRYFEGDLDNPRTAHQPVTCMHCENAPCEPVCPVGATTHSPEGLNEMVYNRCVGTRYCANNCPYKVRRYNFIQYSDFETPVKKLLTNPDVTVRTRGVMEKCTYCVQRINLARIEAKKEDRSVRDGEIVTACQSACPAEAIVFGDLNDSQSRVARAKADSRSYGILTELNTRPRTTYLAKVRNPNPEIEET
jgi:molybdopterin-containing oxidoreductase family iron-sulfur binding subunit